MDLTARAPKSVVHQQLNVHPFRAENYDILCKWWKKRNFPCPKLEHLPPTGFIIANGAEMVSAGFLCKTDSNVAVIWHLASNPEADKETRQSSIDFLVHFMTDRAKQEGFTLVCFSTNIEKLGDRVKQKGFSVLDKNVTVYGRVF